MANIVEDALSCHICAEIFKDPVQFPCSHSLCQSCLERLLESSVGTVLQCPECKDVVQERFIRKNELLASIVDFYWEMTAREDNDAKLINLGLPGDQVGHLLPQHPQNLSPCDTPKEDSPKQDLQSDQPKSSQMGTSNHSDAKSVISKEQIHATKNQAPKIVVTDTEELRSQALEVQFKQLKQVHHQREMQQQHLQRRLRDLQSKLQFKKFVTMKGQRVPPNPNQTDTNAQVLAHFERALGQYARFLKDCHEQQLKSLQVEATKAALHGSNQSPRTTRTKRNSNQNSDKVLQPSNKSPKISRSHREPTREQLTNKIHKLQDSFEKSQLQQQEMWTQLQSMKQSQQGARSDSDSENSSKCDHTKDTEKDLLMFEAKFRQYENLQTNLHNMKVEHLKDKINKMQ